MPIQKTGDDWTDDNVRRIWSWYTERKEFLSQYFSKQVGKALRNVLRSTGRAKGRILDFGCGPGFLMKWLCTIDGTECFGLDFSEKNVESTNDRLQGNPNFKGAEVVDSLPSGFDAGSFDVITCIEVVEHLSDEYLENTLGEVKRLLKPGGIAMFTTPNQEVLDESQTYCPFCDSQFHTWQHVRNWSPELLKTKLGEHGLKVLFCEGLDLYSFQRQRGKRFFEITPAYLLEKISRAAKATGSVLLDSLASRRFPANRRFQWRLKGGPHLVAIVEQENSEAMTEG